MGRGLGRGGSKGTTRANITSPEATTAGKAMATTDTTGVADKKEIGDSTGSLPVIPTTMADTEAIGKIGQGKAMSAAIRRGPDMETGTGPDMRIATEMNMGATSAAP